MGYYTSSLLCMPVKNSYEEIIAVAQVNNKNPDKDDGHFTSMDEKVNILHTGPKLLRVVLTQCYFERQALSVVNPMAAVVQQLGISRVPTH